MFASPSRSLGSASTLRPNATRSRPLTRLHCRFRTSSGRHKRRRATSGDDRIGRLKRWPARADSEAIAALPLSLSEVAQRRRPALADIIGARQACTVAMISSVSMP